MPVKVLIPHLLGAVVQSLATRKAKKTSSNGEEVGEVRELSVPRILAATAAVPSLVELGSSGGVVSDSMEVLVFQAFAAIGAVLAKLVMMYLESRKAQS